jgi:hypothetical protein
MCVCVYVCVKDVRACAFCSHASSSLPRPQSTHSPLPFAFYQVRIFLFSDLVVVGRFLSEHNDQMCLELVCPLHNLVVWDLPPNECLPDTLHCFELARLDTKMLLVVVSADAAQKARWLRCLLTQSLLRFRRRK